VFTSCTTADCPASATSPCSASIWWPPRTQSTHTSTQHNT
jgi:hypothetical protein